MMAWTREEMAARAARRNSRTVIYVNLGIGIPTLVANCDPRRHACDACRARTACWAWDPFPYEGDEDPDLINAGKQTITELPTSSFFSSADSFGMIRGGHIDLTVLGAMEVSENGDIANWTIPGKMLKGHGRRDGSGCRGQARDRRHGARQQAWRSRRCLKRCTLPLTGAGCVDMVITDLCVFDVDRKGGGMKLVELAPGVTLGRGESPKPRPAFDAGTVLHERGLYLRRESAPRSAVSAARLAKMPSRRSGGRYRSRR